MSENKYAHLRFAASWSDVERRLVWKGGSGIDEILEDERKHLDSLHVPKADIDTVIGERRKKLEALLASASASGSGELDEFRAESKKKLDDFRTESEKQHGEFKKKHHIDDSHEPADHAVKPGTLEQRSEAPAFKEALMIGAGLSAVPAAASIAAAAPEFAALPASAQAAAIAPFGIPVGLGGYLGYKLGKRWGHPVMGTAAGLGVGTAAGYGTLAAAPTLAAAAGAATTELAGTFVGPAVAPWLVGAGAIGVPAALGGWLGYRMGGRYGSVAGTLGGAGLGAGILYGGASIAPLAAAGAPLAAAALVPAAAAGGTYLGGKLHRWLWNTPGHLGTWSTIGRGALSPVTVPARALNWGHELAWDTPMATSKWGQLGRTIISPASIPIGVGVHRLGVGAAVGGFFRGFDSKYEPKHEDRWFLPRWLEKLTSIPGRLTWSIFGALKGLVADPEHKSILSAVTSAPRKFWSHLWAPSKPMY